MALALCALTALALALRWPGAHQALYGDELFTYDIVTTTGLGGLLGQIRDTSITPPLHYLLAYAAQKLGDPPVSVRLPSLLAGAAAVPLVYLLGARTVGRRAALLGATFAAISPFLVFYGSEARAYALLMALLLICTLALLGALRPGASRWWWALFAVSGAASLYTHYTAAIYLAAQAAWALYAYRERRRAVLGANALVAVAFAPWIPSYIDQRRNPGVEAVATGFPKGLSAAPEGYLERLAVLVTGHPFLPLRELPGRAWLLVAALAALAALVSTLVAHRRRAGGPASADAASAREGGSHAATRSPLLLIALLAASLPVGLILYRIGGTNLFAPRNLIPSLPAMLLLLAALFTRVRGPAGPVLAAVFAAALVAGTIDSLRAPARRPPWNLAARWLDRNAGPGVPVAQGDIVALLGKRRALFYDMAIFFDRAHPWFLPAIVPGSWDEAVKARRVAIAYSIVPGKPAADGPPPAGRWRRERTLRWRGLNGVGVTTWVRVGGRPASVPRCPPMRFRDHRRLDEPSVPCSAVTPLR